mmetsp:Transcript_35212/g.39286  ORF Transcript_35212/g.39286 Transcript_35212/m.39286 type:complete len:167 (+) Transcript_35212:66-566(+)
MTVFFAVCEFIYCFFLLSFLSLTVSFLIPKQNLTHVLPSFLLFVFLLFLLFSLFLPLFVPSSTQHIHIHIYIHIYAHTHTHTAYSQTALVATTSLSLHGLAITGIEERNHCGCINVVAAVPTVFTSVAAIAANGTNEWVGFDETQWLAVLFVVHWGILTLCLWLQQ